MGQEAEVFARNGIAIDELGGGRRPGAPAALARQRRGHARGAAGERLGRGRPDPHARRVPDRVEQAARASARGRLAAGEPARARGVRPGAGRLRRRLDAPARGLGRALRRAARPDRRAAHEPARADAGRHPGRLRAHDAAAGGRRSTTASAEQGLDRPADVPRQLEHAQPGQHRDRRGARARGGAGRVRRDAARGRHPARGAGGVPRGPLRGVVGELPLLRGAALLRLARGGGPRGAPALRAGVRRHAPAEHDRAARAGADHAAGQAGAGAARPAARRGGRRGAGGERRRGGQHRLPARAGRLQHPARGGASTARRCAASTCSARPRRSTPTSAT